MMNLGQIKDVAHGEKQEIWMETKINTKNIFKKKKSDSKVPNVLGRKRIISISL